MSLPAAVYSTAQVRALDRYAIDRQGIPGYVLMERAAAACLRLLRGRYPAARRVVIVCGGGNNGGDGYVLARLALAASLKVVVLAAVAPDKLQGDARHGFTDWLAAGGSVAAFDAAALRDADLLVDALCGTGLSADLRADACGVVMTINAAGRPVLSLDVPSGLCSDTGRVLGAAVNADATITFVGLKQGLFLGGGPRQRGALFFDDLSIVAPGGAEFAPVLQRLMRSDLDLVRVSRPRDAHKGLFGQVLVVGGGNGMPGAAALAARAALRVGAGRVRVACAPGSLAAIAGNTAEAMVRPINVGTDLDACLTAADTVLLGPGLGLDAWARACWSRALALCRERQIPLVIDADGLNLLADEGAEACNWVLTPHPGEAARLAQISNAQVQDDRLGTLTRLTDRYGGIVVLKGACTLLGATGRTPAVCDAGNPGMATAGMGDVLAGAIAGLLAQLRDPWLAARAAVLAHALAGDAAAQAGGERGLIASDVIEALRAQVNP